MQDIDYQHLKEELSHSSHPGILVVGDFMLDGYVYGDADRISPEAPVPVLNVVEREYRCGGAAAVAVNIAALQGHPLCIGVLGEDQPADNLCRMLDGKGIDPKGLLQDSRRITPYKERLVGLAQHRHRQQLLRVDFERIEALPHELQQKLLKQVDQALDHAQSMCIQDHKKGFVLDGFGTELVTLARSKGKRVLVDPPRDGDLMQYHGASVVTPNRYEASQFVGYRIETVDQARNAAEQITRQLDLEGVVITMDRDGAYFWTPERSGLVPTQARNVYDVTGAGDMVVAAIAMGLADGMDLATAVVFSNVAAGLVVGRFGNEPVSRQEILDDLDLLLEAQSA